jgi:hypothetical protein
MDVRPVLDRKLDASAFRSYYWLKSELAEFCRANGLPSSGNKEELTDRIALYLGTGEITRQKHIRGKKVIVGEITEDTVIEPNLTCSEKHRAFFRDKIGEGFSFNVPFQKWLKANAGKTYGQAVATYYEILDDRKEKRTVIGGQFEYNAYIRAFFEDNRGMTLQQAILCWRYKKSIKGPNTYEKGDLIALK